MKYGHCSGYKNGNDAQLVKLGAAAELDHFSADNKR